MAEAFLDSLEMLQNQEVVISDDEVEDMGNITDDLLGDDFSLHPFDGVFESWKGIMDNQEAASQSGPASRLSTPSPVSTTPHKAPFLPENQPPAPQPTIPEPAKPRQILVQVQPRNTPRTIAPANRGKILAQLTPKPHQLVTSPVGSVVVCCAEQASIQQQRPLLTARVGQSIPLFVQPYTDSTGSIVGNVVGPQSYGQPAQPPFTCYTTIQPQPFLQTIPAHSTFPHYPPQKLLGQPQILYPGQSVSSYNSTNYANPRSASRGKTVEVREVVLDANNGGPRPDGSTNGGRKRKAGPETMRDVKILRRSVSATEPQNESTAEPDMNNNTTMTVDTNKNGGFFIDLNSMWPSDSGAPTSTLDTALLTSSSHETRGGSPWTTGIPSNGVPSSTSGLPTSTSGTLSTIMEVEESSSEKYMRELEEDGKKRQAITTNKIKARQQSAISGLKALVPGLDQKSNQCTVLEYSLSYVRFLRKHAQDDLDKEFQQEMNRIEFQNQNWSPDIACCFNFDDPSP